MPAANPSVLLTSRGAATGRFATMLVLGALAACAAYAALVLHSATWPQARQLDEIFPFYRWRIRGFTAAELSQAWRGLALLAALLGGSGLLVAATTLGRAGLRAWGAELRLVAAGQWGAWAHLPRWQRRTAGGALAALTALRAWLSLPHVTPGYDDVPSYELFASKSLLAVSAYYPVPNNHVLSNTLSWCCYHVNPGFWFTMRLPVLLAATAATGLFFTNLLRMRTGFGVALLAVGMFGMTQLSLYHAAVGRGYWLLTLWAGLVFFSTVALANGTQQPRAAQTALLLGGILGLFTVPTFALVLVPGYSWLGLHSLRQRHWAGLGLLTGLAAATALGGLLLYAPLLFVSGPASLFQNGFVAPLPVLDFWAGFPAYWWQTEGFLAGQMSVGAVLTLAGLATAVLGLRRARAGLAMPRLRAWQQLVPAALWFVLLPYAVLAVQRVFAPSRALLYKAFFCYLLLGLALDWLLRVCPPQRRRGLRVLLGLGLLLWAGYQLNRVVRDNQATLKRNAALHAAFDWLAHRPPGPLLVPEPTQSLFLRMYLHAERPGQTWQLDARPQTGTRYRYVLAFPNQRGQFQPRFTTTPVFHNEQVDIYYAPDVPPATYWYLTN